MIDPFSAVFGGSNTSSTQQANSNAVSNSNSVSNSTPSNFNPFTGSLGGLVNNVASNGLPSYNGALTAPLSGNENSVLASLMQQQGQGGGVAGTNTYLQDVLAGKYMPGSVNGNPFLQQAITAAQQPTMNNLSSTLSRDLPGYFTANGQMISPNNNGQGGSSAFDTAAALATQSAATTMGNIASTISSGAYDQGIQQQTAAVSLSQQEVQNTVANLQAQSLPRMITDLGIQNGLSLFQTNLSGILQFLQTLGSTAQPVLGNTSNATGTSASNSQSNSNATSTADSTPGILPDISSLVGAARGTLGGGTSTPVAAGSGGHY